MQILYTAYSIFLNLPLYIMCKKTARMKYFKSPVQFLMKYILRTLQGTAREMIDKTRV